jgi:MoaD family protein
MIEVTVKYFNILSDYARKKDDTVSLAEMSTVFDLVMNLVERNPPSFGSVVISDGALSSFIRIFVNDEMVSGEGIDNILHDGDKILLFPAVSGG